MPEISATSLLSKQDICILIGRIVRELAPHPDAGVGNQLKLVDELEYTSLALLELAFTLEDEFELPPIDEETARKIVTIADVEAHVLDGLRERGLLADDGAARARG
jgi:acyl carrier protein